MVSLLALLPLLIACQERDPCPDGSMLDGDQGLELTPAEHGAGWAQTDCFACHAVGVLHRTGCSPDVDLEGVQAIVEAEGLSSCAGCHGDNGVVP